MQAKGLRKTILMSIVVLAIAAFAFFYFSRQLLTTKKPQGAACKVSFPPPQISTLRSYAQKKNLLVGTIPTGGSLKSEPLKTLLGSEFNLLIGTTFMKAVMPAANTFDFSLLDQQIAYAKQHMMKIMAVDMIYRNSTTPSWLGFNNPGCGGWGDSSDKKKQLEAIMKQYIQTTIEHAGDVLFATKIVNEAQNVNGDLKKRDADGQRCWYKALGDSYIYDAFKFAASAKSRSLLILNDSFGRNDIDRAKTDAFFTLAQQIKKKVPQAAGRLVAGIQMHLDNQNLLPAYRSDFDYFLQQAGKQKMQVMITEMTVCQATVGDASAASQAQVYATIVSVCLKYPYCTSFSTWGVTDKKTSEDDKCQVANPLLFDTNWQRKPAYYAVMKAIEESTDRCSN